MRQRSLLAVACAAAVGLAGCGSAPASNPATSTPTVATTSATPTTTTAAPSTTTEPATTRADAPGDVPDDAQKATVARIVDGDTLELAAATAGAVLGSTQQVDVRLLEIDTPETKHPSEPVQCYGKQATNRLSELAPPGSTVWVQRDEELRDQYGRYLLYMWTADGTFVNLTMVEDGYAAAKLYEPNDRHWSTISAAEADAKAAGAGLWGACDYFGQPVNTPEPTPEPQPEDDGGAYLFPPPPPDKDCGSISANSFRVRPGDPHRFDSDGDGIGCEG